MNKFDAENDNVFTAFLEAERRHPDPDDGPAHRFPVWRMPLVEVDGLYGQAVAYTRSYGLITWRDSDRVQRMEWFPASHIRRVERNEWPGR